jgi:hypothetical protein
VSRRLGSTWLTSMRSTADGAPLVLVLCGNCGAGKSSTANMLLGQQIFVSQRSAAAITMECQKAERIMQGERRSEGGGGEGSDESGGGEGRGGGGGSDDGDQGGGTLIVLDTPGLSDPEATQGEIHGKIIDAMARMAEAHPDARFAVGLVVSLAGRLDETALDAFYKLGLVFGRELYSHAVLIWTHGDLLLEETAQDAAAKGEGAGRDASVADMHGAFESYVAGAGESVSAFLQTIKGGSLVLSNRPNPARTASASASVSASSAAASAASPSVAEQQLEQVVERAASIAAPYGRLTPPKSHRKAARRERQLALFQEMTDGRVRERQETAGFLSGLLAWIGLAQAPDGDAAPPLRAPGPPALEAERHRAR